MAAVSDDLLLWHALYGLEVRYWREVDANGGENAHSFYTDDGLFAVGENEFPGRERIQQFYAWRGRRGMDTVRSLRTTRHLISNFWVQATGEREATAFGVISFHDGSGRAPVRESNPPVMVADLVSVCVLDEEGAWRFKSHRLRPVFMGAEVPLSMAVDLTR
jgi:SnoaL-like protein